MKHTDKCKFTSQGTYKCLRIKFYVFAHARGAVFPRKLSCSTFSGELRSPAAHPPRLCRDPSGAGAGMAPIHSSFFLNHRILCLRPWKKRKNGQGVRKHRTSLLKALLRALRVLLAAVSIGQKTELDSRHPDPLDPKWSPDI